MIELLIVGRGRPGMPVDEQRTYMKDVHGASVVRLIAEDPDVAPRRYVQNHVSASYATAGAPDEARDFVTQVWFDDPAQMEAALTTPRYVDELQPDEDNFVDQTSVAAMPVEATVLRPRQAGASAKVILLHAADPPADTLLASADGVRGHVRNRVVRPGGPYSTVDEVWFEDLATADAAARHWTVGGALPASVLLVADEHVLHDGPTN